MKVVVHKKSDTIFSIQSGDMLDVIMRMDSFYEPPYESAIKKVELFEFMGIKGLAITTDEGLFHTDLRGGGIYYLNQVEDVVGNMLHIEDV